LDILLISTTLELGSVVNNRYQIQQILQQQPFENIYLLKEFQNERNYLLKEVISRESGKASIAEERTLYKNGNIDRENTAFDTRMVRYSLQLDKSQLKISDYQDVKVTNTK